jgi:hypothetical protein
MLYPVERNYGEWEKLRKRKTTAQEENEKDGERQEEVGTMIQNTEGRQGHIKRGKRKKDNGW